MGGSEHLCEGCVTSVQLLCDTVSVDSRSEISAFRLDKLNSNWAICCVCCELPSTSVSPSSVRLDCDSSSRSAQTVVFLTGTTPQAFLLRTGLKQNLGAGTLENFLPAAVEDLHTATGFCLERYRDLAEVDSSVREW